MADYYAHQAEDNRTRALQQGDVLNQQIQQQLQARYDLEHQYRTSADALYSDLQNQPGYSDQQAQDILGINRLNALQLTPEQQQSNYLTDAEQNDIRGDPGSLVGQAQHGASMVYSGLQNAGEGIGNTEGFERTALGNAYSDLAQNSRAAIDPSKLGLSQDYTNAAGAALGSGTSNIMSAVTNPDLGVSQDYSQNYQFTPEDQEQMALAAERGIGTASRARQEDVARAAAASGGMSPLALAAGYNRLAQTGDINAADAATDARIAAKQLGLNVTQGREDTRQAAVGRNAQLQASAEQGLLNTQLGAAAQGEQLRQGAQQFITGAQLQNEQNLGNQQLTNERGLGQQAIDAQQQLAALGLSGTEYAEGTQLGTSQYAEQTAAQRAANIAANRQSTNQYNQGANFQTGTYSDTAQANRYSQVANQQLAGQQELRNYNTQQGQYEGNQATNLSQQQIGLYGTQYGLANQATGIAANYDLGKSGQSFGTAFKQGLGSSLGKTLGGQ